MTVQPTHYRADLAEAKDLHLALSLLAPARRIRWLRLCCLKLSLGQPTRVDVVRSSGEVKDVLGDFWTICGQGPVTLEWATELAETMLRGYDVRELL